jgi:hypothetical protein
MGSFDQSKKMFFYQVGVPAFGQFAAWCPTGVFDMNTMSYDAHENGFSITILIVPGRCIAICKKKKESRGPRQHRTINDEKEGRKEGSRYMRLHTGHATATRQRQQHRNTTHSHHN